VIRELIAFAKRHGVVFAVQDDRLVVTGLRRLSKKRQAEVRASRAGILEILVRARRQQEPATLSDAELTALGFTRLTNGCWSHNDGDSEGARILALDRATMQPLIDEGLRRIDQDMIDAGLRLPLIERVVLRPGRHAGHSTFVRERGRRYLRLPHEDSE
jgi:hypothetical protein